MSAAIANSRLLNIAPSGIRAIHDRKRPTSLNLGIGEPSLKPDVAPFETAVQWVREHGCPYTSYAGIPELRELAANVYGGKFSNSADNVCVTNGSQEAIFLAIKTLAEPGRDEVLVANPGYPIYHKVCELEGITWRAVSFKAEDSFTPRADAILSALKPNTRLIVLASPANPTGAVMPPSEVAALARGLSARPGPPVYVLADEVYRELTYTAEPFRSIADEYPYTVSVLSLSKSCALTGLRIGFLIAPREIAAAAGRMHSLVLMSASQFGQRVALDIFRDPVRLRAHLPWYIQQRALMLETAKRNHLDFIEPAGAFYVLVRLPERLRRDSTAAAYTLLEKHDVVTVPGAVFASNTEGYLRVTWAAGRDAVVEGLARLGEFVRV
jgi:aspartate/methionine/tyrosine aminotransferase